MTKSDFQSAAYNIRCMYRGGYLSISELATKFDGVDKEMATKLRALQSALQTCFDHAKTRMETR